MRDYIEHGDSCPDNTTGYVTQDPIDSNDPWYHLTERLGLAEACPLWGTRSTERSCRHANVPMQVWCMRCLLLELEKQNRDCGRRRAYGEVKREIDKLRNAVEKGSLAHE